MCLAISPPALRNRRTRLAATHQPRSLLQPSSIPRRSGARTPLNDDHSSGQGTWGCQSLLEDASRWVTGTLLQGAGWDDFDVDQHRAVDPPFAQRELVHPDHTYPTRRGDGAARRPASGPCTCSAKVRRPHSTAGHRNRRTSSRSRTASPAAGRSAGSRQYEPWIRRDRWAQPGQRAPSPDALASIDSPFSVAASFSRRSAADRARVSNPLCAVSGAGARAPVDWIRGAASLPVSVFLPMTVIYPLTGPLSVSGLPCSPLLVLFPGVRENHPRRGCAGRQELS